MYPVRCEIYEKCSALSNIYNYASAAHMKCEVQKKRSQLPPAQREGNTNLRRVSTPFSSSLNLARAGVRFHNLLNNLKFREFSNRLMSPQYSSQYKSSAHAERT